MRFLRQHRDWVKRGLVICMCLLVFVFVLHPRFNLHGEGYVGKVQLREHTKLRPEAKTTQVVVPAVITVRLAATVVYFLLFRGQPVMQRILHVLAPRDVMPEYHRQTFLRPPPAFSH